MFDKEKLKTSRSNEINTFQNLWDAATNSYRGKFINLILLLLKKD